MAIMQRLPATAAALAAFPAILGAIVIPLSCATAAAPAAPAAILRTAAQDNNAIKYNPKGRHKGVCLDVLQAIERVQPGLRFTGQDRPMSLPRIESALADGQLDVFCALIRSQAREAKFDFIDVPVYVVRRKIAVRANDDVQVQTLDDIRKLGPDNVIIVAKGTAHEELLKRQPGLTLDAGSRDLDVNLRKLLHGRGRFLYHTENSLLHYIDMNKLGGKIRLLPAALKEDGMYFAVSRSLPAASADLLRRALQQLAERGELKKIYANYKEE
jgi:ABC-type amino acid transport substrate-binding protein